MPATALLLERDGPTPTPPGGVVGPPRKGEVWRTGRRGGRCREWSPYRRGLRFEPESPGRKALLDIKWIRENHEALDRGWRPRRREPTERLNRSEPRRGAPRNIQKLQEAQARRNSASKEIGEGEGEQGRGERSALMAEVAALKGAIRDGEAKERDSTTSCCSDGSPRSRTCRDDVPVGPTRPATSSCAGARRATSTSRRAAFRARRSARPHGFRDRRRSSRARASSC